MVDAEPEKQDRALSLPSLQNLMKRDPEAYALEFDQQWSHFTSMMELWKLKPQKPHSAFSEQVMFLAHVGPSFPAKAAALPGVLIDALGEHAEVMHPQMRQTLVQALVLLRNRDQFPCMRTLPVYFKLFRLQDKSLRHMIFAHIVRDLVQMGQKTRSQKTSSELRDFFFGQLKEADVEVARRACAVFISLYRQNVWRDNHVVNLMSSGLLHPDVKCAAALAHLFLGNRTKGLEGILEESDKEDEDAAEEAVRGIVGAKKTANREKRVERAKKAAKKALRKKKAKQMESGVGGVSFVAIDLINDPQALADRLLQRVSKGSEPFLFRLLMLHLVARLVGRHELFLLNLYPFLLKYLVPTQREVTKVLACLVEACHVQIPPEELRPVILHIMHSFVTEAQAPEVIEVGLNGIREVCSRAVNILTEEELADLAGFRKHKNKGVAMAARSLINTYRELHPQLLHRSLRGREATMALSRGEVAEPTYGISQANDRIDGLELLSAKEEKRKRASDDNSNAVDPQKAAEGAKQLMAERVIGSDEFKQLRKLRLQKSVQMQLGRKRKAEEISSSSGSDSECSDSEEEISDGEQGMPGRLPDAVSGDLLKATKKKGHSKKDKESRIKEGRTDFKEKLAERAKARRGGSTNKEKTRNKPLLMTMQSKQVKQKKAQTSKQKLTNLRKHISTLKKTANHQKRRR